MPFVEETTVKRLGELLREVHSLCCWLPAVCLSFVSLSQVLVLLHCWLVVLLWAELQELQFAAFWRFGQLSTNFSLLGKNQRH